MSDIFTEVDDDVRRDKAEQFWKTYQNHIFALALAIVLAAAGFRYYEYRQTLAAQAAGAAFTQAIALDKDGKSAEAQTALASLASGGPSGYAILARLTSAGLLAKSDAAGAIKAYDALSADAAVGPLFRDSAALRGALLRLDAGEADRAKSALEALAGASGAFRHSAREALGALALQAGDIETAGKWLDLAVADPQAPPGVKANAEALLGLVAARRPGPK